MKRLLLSLLVCLCVLVPSYSQVNLQTGAAQVSIPLYSYSDNNELNCNIGLDYFDGNGLKVSEVASAVGTGWALQAGGVIIREQRGLPDDQKRAVTSVPLNMSFDDYDNLYYPEGYLYTQYNPSDNISNEGGYVKMWPRSPGGQDLFGNPVVSGGNIPIKEQFAADREQDVFHLRCGDLNADFVIGKDGSIKVLNDCRLKIVFQTTQPGNGRQTVIDQFTATDINGINYIFSAEETATLCTYRTRRYPDASNGTWQIVIPGTNPSTSVSVYPGDPTSSFMTTKWFLTQIVNPRTSSSIDFTYEQYNLDMYEAATLSYIQSPDGQTGIVTLPRDILNTWRIKTITYPDKVLNFTYETTPRIDVPNQLPLKELQIIDRSTSSIIKTYEFNYGYFFKQQIVPYTYQFASSDIFYARLSLQSIQVLGSDGITSVPPYKFDYYLGDGGNYGLNIVPPSWFYWTDDWGYYCPNNSNLNRFPQFYQPNQVPTLLQISDLCANSNTVRAPFDGYAKNGIIKTITYPYGGSLTYQYEQNTAYYNSQNVLVGGVRVSSTTLYDGTDHAKDIIKQYKYLLPDETSSSGWGYEPQTHSRNQDYRTYKDASGYTGVTFREFSSTLISTYIEKHNWGLIVMNGNPRTVPTQRLDGSIYNVALPSNVSPMDELGGYLSETFASMAISMAYQIIADIFSSSDPQYKDQSETIYSFKSNESSNPLPYQYSRVEVIDKTSTGDNGESVYEFTSDVDKSIYEPTYSFPFAYDDRYDPWAYGLLKHLSIYNNNTPVRKLLIETINQYDFNKVSFLDDPNFESNKWEAGKLIYDVFPPNQSVAIPSYQDQYGNITSKIYYPLIGHTELTSTIKRTYNKNDNNYEESTTNYTYSPTNFQLKTVTTTNSKGETLEKQVYYPEDYTSSGFIASLVSDNIVDVPLSMETWKTAPNNPPVLISSTATDYSTIGNGDIKPYRDYSLETTAPVSQSTLQPFNPASVVRDPNYIKQETQNVYDDLGDLTQTIGRTKPSTATYRYDKIIDNNKTGGYFDVSKELVTANVVNANPGEFAYTSFEGDNQGNWDYDKSAVVAQSCPTGDHCLQLSLHNNISISNSTIGISKPYILSYWALGSNITVNSSAYNLEKTVTNPSGWTYYEYRVNGNPINQVVPPTITGDGYIDEVRLYPADARMTTYTYDFAGNKTSACDENNHIQYYKYDALGRMTQVLDEMGNVIKQYEFNYKQ